MFDLLVTDRPFKGLVASAIRKIVKVIQETPPHVIIVEGDADAIRTVRGLPGVKSGDSINQIKEKLNLTEVLTIESWAANAVKEEREHDGLNWGTFGKGP